MALSVVFATFIGTERRMLGKAFRVTMIMVENWFMTMETGLECIVVAQCMFACYMALYIRSKQILDFPEYRVFAGICRGILIYSHLINDFFQTNLAWRLKLIVIFTNLIFGTNTYHFSLRKLILAYLVCLP